MDLPNKNTILSMLIRLGGITILEVEQDLKIQMEQVEQTNTIRQ